MAEAIEISLDDDGRQVVQPPIIDSLQKDKSRKVWSILFVPEESVSDREKERVSIPFNSADGRRIQTRMDRLGKLFGRPIERIYHGGGGNFSLHFQRGKPIGLLNPRRDPGLPLRAYVELTDISMTAQIAFISSRLAAAG